MDPTQTLLDEIEAFLSRSEMSPTAFGRSAVRDPSFVFKLRDGREPRRKTREKAMTFLAEQGAAQ